MVPFLTLGKLTAHKQEFFARMCHLITQKQPKIGKLPKGTVNFRITVIGTFSTSTT